MGARGLSRRLAVARRALSGWRQRGADRAEERDPSLGEQLLLDDRGLAAVVRDVTDLFTGLGPAERLLRAPDVTDVMINGPGEVWIERAGRLERTDVTYPDADAVRAAVLRVVGPQGLRFDRAHPTVDTRLADGSRLHAVGAPLTSAGPLVTVRRFATVAHSWDDLEAGDAVPPVARRLLTEAVADRRAIVCCGRTGTGKTTLLGVLLSEVSAAERVVVAANHRARRAGALGYPGHNAGVPAAGLCRDRGPVA